jgi:hypothetical protein
MWLLTHDSALKRVFPSAIADGFWFRLFCKIDDGVDLDPIGRVAHPFALFARLDDTTSVRQLRGTALAFPGGRPFRVLKGRGFDFSSAPWPTSSFERKIKFSAPFRRGGQRSGHPKIQPQRVRHPPRQLFAFALPSPSSFPPRDEPK